MLRARCEAEDVEVLLTTRRITAIRLSPGASEIAFTCWCGHPGVIRDPRPLRSGPVADDRSAGRVGDDAGHGGEVGAEAGPSEPWREAVPT